MQVTGGFVHLFGTTFENSNTGGYCINDEGGHLEMYGVSTSCSAGFAAGLTTNTYDLKVFGGGGSDYYLGSHASFSTIVAYQMANASSTDNGNYSLKLGNFWSVNGNLPNVLERNYYNRESTFSVINQSAAGSYAGTCIFASSTTCVVTYGTAYNYTPVVQITPINPDTTVNLTATSKTGFTLTAATTTSMTVNWVAIGNGS